MQDAKPRSKVRFNSRISTVVDPASLAFPQIIPSEELWKFEETWVDFESILSPQSPSFQGVSRAISKLTAKHRRNKSLEKGTPSEVIPLSPIKATKATEQSFTIFSTKQKVYIAAIATIGGSFSPFTSNIYYPVITTISRDLSVSVSKIDLTVTAYMVFQALAPAAVSALSDERGRRPFYAIGFALFMIANLGLALNKTFIGLLLLRCLQSIGSSGLTALKAGTISDFVTSVERGRYIAITSIPMVLAPSLGSICGGLLAQYFGWQAIFWALLIMSVIFFTPLALMFPETCRNVVGDGSIMPPRIFRCLHERWWRHLPGKGEPYDRYTKPLPSIPRTDQTSQSLNPFAALTIIADPETAMVLLGTGLVNFGVYALSISVTVEFEKLYHLRPASQGLLFIPQLVATIIAALSNARLLDMNFHRYASKAGVHLDKRLDMALDGIPVERARLEIAWPIYCLSGLFITCYGWALHTRCHIFVPIVFMTMFNTTTAIGLGALTVLLVDLHKTQAATASAAATLFRCVFGAAASAIINPTILTIGNGWTFTMVGCLYFASVPLLWICMKYGIDMRRERDEKEEKARNRKQAGTRSGSVFQKARELLSRVFSVFQSWRYSRIEDNTKAEAVR